MLKKTLAVLLACLMTAGIIPMGLLQASAAETDTAAVAATEAQAETVAAENAEPEQLAEQEQDEAGFEIISDRFTGIVGGRLNLYSDPYEEGVVWSSSDEEVATVSDYGLVILKSVGKAEITATAPSGASDTKTVTAVEPGTISTGDTKTIDIQEPGGMVFYEFTPEENGKYIVSSIENESEAGLYGAIYYKDKYLSSSTGGSSELTMSEFISKDDTYYFGFGFYDKTNDTGSFKIKLEKAPDAERVEITNDDPITMYAKTTEYLYTKYYPENAVTQDETWKSSDTDVVQVDGGTVYAINPGTAVVTVTTNEGLSDSITVKVADMESVQPGDSKIVRIEKSRDYVFYKLTPAEDAPYLFWSESDKDTKAELYDSDMYYIDENDDGGENSNFRLQENLTGGKTYYIKVHMYGDFTGTFTFKVKQMEHAQNLYIAQGDRITVPIGADVNLTSVFEPEDCYEENVDWFSSDIETVQVNGYGVVSGLKPGKAVITAKSENGLTDTIEITAVEPETLAEGEIKSGSVRYQNQSFVYTVTPDEDCCARFSVDSDMSFYGVILYNEDKEAIEQEEHSENSTFKAMLKGGKKYTLIISDGSSKAEGSFSVSYEKTEYITDLKITKLPDKTTYVDGYYDYDYLDFTGLEMQATWSDGSISNFVYDNYSANKIRDEYVSFSRSGKTVKISCGEASTSFDIEVVPNPVKSIEIAEDPEISITEYTHGEWKTMYNPETGFYDLRYYYYNVSNFFDDNIQIKINYIDGTSRTASINENVDGYSFWYSDNQYNTPWKIGKNKVNIGYLGETTTFEVEIKESPVDYLEVIGSPKPIVEYTHGDWDTRYNNETGEREEFFYYNSFIFDFEDVRVRIHFKDGSIKEADFYEEVDGYSFETYCDQYEKPFVLGNDNEITVSYMGCEAKVKLAIIESPVARIEVLESPDPVIEKTKGDWDTRYNSETHQNEEYFRYTDLPVYGLKVRVYYKDGTTKDGYIGSSVDDGYSDEYIKYSSSQQEKPFALGSDNLVTVSYLGAQTQLPLTIIPNPVKSISLAGNFKVKVVEGVDGHTDTKYNPQTGNYDLEYFYYYYDGIDKAKILVTYNDGSTEYVYPYKEYNGYYVSVDDNQHEKAWTRGGDNYVTVEYLGFEVEVPVVILPNPVASIELAKPSSKLFYENVDGYFNTDDNDIEYFNYSCETNAFKDAEIKINYTDGTSKTANVGDYIDGYFVGIDVYQRINHWTVGGSNYAKVLFMGKEVQMPVKVVQNPVESITINSAPTRVYVFGDQNYGNTEILNPIDYTGLKFTVNYKNGTKKTYTGEEIEYGKLDGYSVSAKLKERVKIGSNAVTFSYMGKTAEYNVTVKESGIASIEVVKLPTNPVYSNYYVPDWRGLQIKVTYTNGKSQIGTLKDGNMVYGINNFFGPYVGFDFNGVIGLISSRWIKDGNRYIISLADKSCEVTGLTYREDKRVTDVEVENFSESAKDIIFKLTYEGGTKEDVPVIDVKFNDYTFRKQSKYIIAQTSKGMIEFTIPNHELVNTDIILSVFDINVKEKGADEPYPDDRVIGDVNGDGVVDILDATKIQMYASSKIVLNQDQLYCADVNDDGNVDVLDAAQIQKFAVNRISEFKKKA